MLVRTLKNRISSPFDFQHLTHTNRHHFAALQEASENDLASNFRAVRASQAPQASLTGIKVEDLPSTNESTEDVSAPERRSLSAMELRSDMDFIVSTTDVHQEPSPAEDPLMPSLRQVRSVESFSRPGVNPRMHRHTQSANPPPRVSSRPPAIQVQDRESSSVASPLQRQSGVWDSFVPLSPTRGTGLLPSMAEEPDYMGHALTTPDDSAIHTFSPSFSPGLEDVAEEPERFVSPRPAPEPPLKSPRSPSYETLTFGQRPSFSRHHRRKSSHVLPKQLVQPQGPVRRTSQMSEPHASPALSRRQSVRKGSCVRRKSNTWRVIEESWEDDIDYIYDNALEAECDFDWDHTEDRDRTPEQDDHRRISNFTNFTSNSSLASPMMTDPASPRQDSFRSSLLVPNTHNIAEIEPRSALTVSTADVPTPSDYFGVHNFPQSPFGDVNRFSFAPSLLGPQDYKDQPPREDIYDNLLDDYEGEDRHFPLLESAQSVSSSTRSSRVRTSKCSSYDSSLMSSGHGSGSWSTGIRRSASSAGSLPELVHSSRARQDFSVVVDKLADQVASIRHDNDDDDVTPPGNSSPERTFLARGDDHEATESAPTNAEMKTSLELARQGSISKRTQPLHKHAASDGAAKMLSPNPSKVSTDARSAAKSRTRSRSNSTRLSLFPSPPKQNPVPLPSPRISN